MKRVFVDSGGFFALLTAEDRFHDHARSLFSRANAERWRLVTTNAVVVETYSLLLARSRGGRRAALAFLLIHMANPLLRPEVVPRNERLGLLSGCK